MKAANLLSVAVIAVSVACVWIACSAADSVPAGAEVYTSSPFDAHEAARRQEATAKALGVPKELVLDLGSDSPMRLVLIPAGRFVMERPKGEAVRQHEVTVTPPFYMGVHEVTQSQYRAIMWTWRRHGEIGKGPSLPVETAFRSNALDFCDQVSARTGRQVSLPTEAQWEYACRAGTATAFNTGETIRRDQANIAAGRHSEPLLPVASIGPNAFGLYGMLGSVLEWCSDQYHRRDRPDPFAAPAEALREGAVKFPPDPFACRSLSETARRARFRVVAAVNVTPDTRSPIEKAQSLLAAARQLKDSDEQERRRITLHLARLGRAAKPAILSAVKDSDKHVRACASLALSYMPDMSDIPLLLGPIDMWGADVALEMLGPSVVAPLLATIRQSSVARRDLAVRVLYDIDPVAAADPVLELGKRDTEPWIRYAALLTALSHGDKRAMEPLLALIKADVDKAKPDETNQYGSRDEQWAQALQALLQRGDKRAADLFLSAMEAGKLTAWDIEGHVPRDPRLVPLLIKALDGKNTGCLPHWSADLLSLYHDDPRALAALTAHGWTNVKEKSLKGESLESLLAMLRARDERSAEDAARELGRRREKRAVKPLLELAFRANGWAPHAALEALGEIGDPSAIAPLVEFVGSGPLSENTDWDCRRPAIKALGRLRAKEAIESLVIIASDPDSYDPHEAIEALGAIGGQRARETLDRIFRTSPDFSLRRCAWQALCKNRCGVGSNPDKP